MPAETSGSQMGVHHIPSLFINSSRETTTNKALHLTQELEENKYCERWIFKTFSVV